MKKSWIKRGVPLKTSTYAIKIRFKVFEKFIARMEPTKTAITTANKKDIIVMLRVTKTASIMKGILL